MHLVVQSEGSEHQGSGSTVVYTTKTGMFDVAYLFHTLTSVDLHSTKHRCQNVKTFFFVCMYATKILTNCIVVALFCLGHKNSQCSGCLFVSGWFALTTF